MSALPVSPKRPRPTRIDRRMGTEESDSPGPILLPFLHLALRTGLISAIGRPFGRPLRPDRDEPPLPLLNGQRERSGGQARKIFPTATLHLEMQDRSAHYPAFLMPLGGNRSAGTARREPLGGNCSAGTARREPLLLRLAVAGSCCVPVRSLSSTYLPIRLREKSVSALLFQSLAAF